jgi:predicted nucleic acid-binding protein
VIFADIPIGASIFLDANVFVYHFAPHPVLQPACQQLLEQISRAEIAGHTSSDVLSDVAHRLMTIEARDTYGWPQTGIAYRLKGNPTELSALVRFRQAVEEIPRMGVQVLSVTASHVVTAAALSQQHGLLSGDALVAAIMQAEGLAQLASNDADFDRVSWITRYAPA